MALILPEAELIDPASVTRYRWGVIGAGGIAETFVASVQKHTRQQIVAVASRTPGKAEAFAEKFGIDSHESYEELLARKDIDVVYIATLPNQHRDHALLAIAAGKHVLVEKPVALIPGEAREIFDAAKQRGLLAMEAMWTRYLPQADVIRKVLASGQLGKVEMVNASMCQANLGVARLWEKNHGDPLFDMGIYPISFCQSILGNPESITAQAVLDASGIDQEVSVQMRYASGARAYVLVSGCAGISSMAQIAGTEARIDVGPEFFIPSQIVLSANDIYADKQIWRHTDAPTGHEGLSYQATAMASYLDAGLIESPIESHDDSVANLETCAKVIELVGADIY